MAFGTWDMCLTIERTSYTSKDVRRQLSQLQHVHPYKQYTDFLSLGLGVLVQLREMLG